PSGLAEPSAADRALTQTLKSALALIDVRVLDHLVVTRRGSVSYYLTKNELQKNIYIKVSATDGFDNFTFLFLIFAF
ncbi:MAG: JAB domain-containing protein, partial [Phycisphaerae bacterium]|nr:JAB domain-containing protein [Phycisphaerae bacterium]